MTKNTDNESPCILIVDDIEANLQALEMMLKDVPAQLVRAVSGREAISKAMRYRPMLILMDIKMPGLNGFEAAYLMHKMPKLKYIPIVFLTASSQSQGENAIIQGYESGAVTDYLFKPVDPYILCSKVEVFLQLYHQQQSVIALEKQLSEKHRQDSLRVVSSGVAHEFQDIIAPILNDLHQLMAEPLTTEHQDWLDKMYQPAFSGNQLVEHLLTYTGEYADIQSVNLPRLAGSYIEALTDNLAEDIHFENFPASEEFMVRLDALELWFVLENLFNNALESMANNPDSREKRLTFQVSKRYVDTPEESVQGVIPANTYGVIEVSDGGHGIPLNEQQRIFDPFFVSEKQERTGKAGLGLCVVYGVVMRMSGFLQVKSTLNEGATFRVYLPCQSVI